MGTITHLHERLRAVPLRISAEEEVVAIAGGLANQALQSGIPAEALVQSGLLAISIPVDFGGLDVSNMVMAEAVAVIAAISPDIGIALAGHFSTLEAIRNAGSEEQRRAIFARVAAGEWFGGLLAGENPASEWSLRLSVEGIGYCLEGEITGDDWAGADWLPLSLSDERGVPRLVLVPRHAPELRGFVDGAGIRRLLFKRLHVAADAVLGYGADAGPMSAALANLLQGAVALGRARRALRSPLQRPAELFEEEHPIHARAHKVEIARAFLQVESLAALVNRCATEIDIAQVTPNASTVRRASQIAAALSIAALPQRHDVSGGVEEAALVELGTSLVEAKDQAVEPLETDRPAE